MGCATLFCTCRDTNRPWLQQWVVARGARPTAIFLLQCCVVFVVFLAAVPLLFLLWQSFFTPQTNAKAAEFTLQNYATAYGSWETLKLFLNSVQFAVGTSIFAFTLGTFLAWLNERTNTPFKALFFALSIIPLIIPGILFTVAWILLGSPKIGIVNLLLQSWFNTECDTAGANAG